jgi:hypothetical protein
MEENTKNSVPAITLAMKDMLANCRDRAQLNLSPRLDYDLVTSKNLVELGYLRPKTIIQKDGKAAVVYYVTNEGADYLSKQQRRTLPLVEVNK